MLREHLKKQRHQKAISRVHFFHYDQVEKDNKNHERKFILSIKLEETL